MSSRDRSLIAAIVLVIAAVGGYFLIVAPKHHDSDKLQTQISSAQTSLSQAEGTVQAGLAAEGEYRRYARQLKSISAAVPTDEQIPQLINELQAASTRNKIGFQEVSVASSSTPAATPTPETTAPTPTAGTAGTAVTTLASFPSQTFSLSLTGSYFSVANLLGTLASFVRADDRHFKASGRLISISAVTLAPGKSGPSTSSTAKATVTPGEVTASITALDYDVPTALLSGATATAGTPTTP